MRATLSFLRYGLADVMQAADPGIVLDPALWPGFESFGKALEIFGKSHGQYR